MGRQSRSEMELQSIEAASTSDAVTFITYVQSLKRQMKQWEKEASAAPPPPLRRHTGRPVWH